MNEHDEDLDIARFDKDMKKYHDALYSTLTEKKLNTDTKSIEEFLKIYEPIKDFATGNYYFRMRDLDCELRSRNHFERKQLAYLREDLSSAKEKIEEERKHSVTLSLTKPEIYGILKALRYYHIFREENKDSERSVSAAIRQIQDYISVYESDE